MSGPWRSLYPRIACPMRSVKPQQFAEIALQVPVVGYTAGPGKFRQCTVEVTVTGPVGAETSSP